MSGAQVMRLPGGRLHLHHGPIDMIVGATGPGRDDGFTRAAQRFETLLEELAAELPRLRAPHGAPPRGAVARAMVAATAPFDSFVTPMAAVAGAGADAICAALANGPGIETAYVNNGGDVALCLAPGHSLRAAIFGGTDGVATLRAADPVRGVATSGWRGRSQSLGIADSVTVLAQNAAKADAAATLIANAVDLPGHPAIRRLPANEVFDDSDLGARPVTVDVGALPACDVQRALARGLARADAMQRHGQIIAATLSLQGAQVQTRQMPQIAHQPERADA